jgi:phosphopentomutase
VVLDSVGCGDAPDADLYGDVGANTLSNIARTVDGLTLPNMAALGLGHLASIDGVPAVSEPQGAFGRLTEASPGKDTTTGHWELAGVILAEPFPTYPNGFPPDVISTFEERIGVKTLGNYPASGTEIIEALGEEHLGSGKPIVYTSADSVFQIAAHEDLVPVDQLYGMCRTARELLTGEHAVGRVIARPFRGTVGAFQRTSRRRDFSLAPPAETLLDALKRSGQDVMGIGKIEDIFAARGLTRSVHTTDNMAGIDCTVDFLKSHSKGLIFTNLVDFDTLYGHRNDPSGYAAALEAFDRRLPDIMHALRRDDLLIVTADHGNDPTFPGTDHSRERVPLLIYGPAIAGARRIGTRSSFADVAASIAELLGLTWSGPGSSFAMRLAS